MFRAVSASIALLLCISVASFDAKAQNSTPQKKSIGDQIGDFGRNIFGGLMPKKDVRKAGLRPP